MTQEEIFSQMLGKDFSVENITLDDIHKLHTMMDANLELAQKQGDENDIQNATKVLEELQQLEELYRKNQKAEKERRYMINKLRKEKKANEKLTSQYKFLVKRNERALEQCRQQGIDVDYESLEKEFAEAKAELAKMEEQCRQLDEKFRELVEAQPE